MEGGRRERKAKMKCRGRLVESKRMKGRESGQYDINEENEVEGNVGIDRNRTCLISVLSRALCTWQQAGRPKGLCGKTRCVTLVPKT
jgi:hypothetical protein